MTSALLPPFAKLVSVSLNLSSISIVNRGMLHLYCIATANILHASVFWQEKWRILWRRRHFTDTIVASLGGGGFLDGGLRRRLGSRSRGGVSNGLIDHLVELASVQDLDKWRPLAVRRNHPDCGSVFDADALSQGVVGLDFIGQRALRVDGEGERDIVGLGKLVGELAQRVKRDDGDLVGKHLVAVLVAKGLAFGIEPACVHGRLEAPGVHGQWEVGAKQRNLVFGRSLAQ